MAKSIFIPFLYSFQIGAQHDADYYCEHAYSYPAIGQPNNMKRLTCSSNIPGNNTAYQGIWVLPMTNGVNNKTNVGKGNCYSKFGRLHAIFSFLGPTRLHHDFFRLFRRQKKVENRYCLKILEINLMKC